MSRGMGVSGLYLLIVLSLVFLHPDIGSLRAQDVTPAPLKFLITGTARSASAGVDIRPGLPLTLHVLRADASGTRTDIAQFQSVLGDEGAFRFENVTAQTGDIVFISTFFSGVQQSSLLVELAAGPSSFELPLILYGTTDNSAVITLTNAQQILDFRPGGVMQVLATYRFRNASDRLYVSPEKTKAGQSVSVTVPLPVGAFGIAFDARERFVVGGTEIAPMVQDTRPVRPDEVHEVVFSYQLPYQKAALIDQDYPFNTEVVEILIAEDTNVRLKGGDPIGGGETTPRVAAFNTTTNTTINPQRPYTQYMLSQKLRAGDRLIYALEGDAAVRPVTVAQRRLLDEGPSLVAIGLLLITVFGVVLGATAFLRRATRRA